MGNRSARAAGKARGHVSLISERLAADTSTGAAAQRVNAVLQKMTAPPETLLDHMKRLGIEPIIDEMALMSDDGEVDRKVWVMIDFKELMEKESAYISAGDQLADVYPEGRPRPAQHPQANTPTTLNELRARMNLGGGKLGDPIT